MEHFAAVIIPHKNTGTKKDNIALKNLLFSPVISWVKRAVNQNQIRDVLLVENSDFSIADTNLSEIKSWRDTPQEAVSAIFVISGDTPLVSAKDITNSLVYHKAGGQSVTLFSSFSGKSSGMGWYNTDILKSLFASLEPDFTLHDLYEHFSKQDIDHSIFSVDDKTLLTASTAKKRADIAKIIKQNIIDEHLQKGVEIQVSDGVVIGADVEIGENTEILPGTTLMGKTKIGKNCIIGPNSDIRDSVIGDGCKIDSSQIEQSVVGEETKIGPMSHLRPNSTLGKKVKIGNFVEVKNSILGDSTSVSHLTYIGDSDVGEKCNFGCGVVTVNYDGKNKNRTTVGDNVFVGCNCNLIAPVTLGDRAYAAAGTTITDDVPEDSFVIGRSRQEIKRDWCKNKAF